MMKTDDLENELRNLKFIHLTETELAAYCEQLSDPIDRARMDAHLTQCFICARRLALLRAERAALDQHEATADEVAWIERLVGQMGLTQPPSADPPVAVVNAGAWSERLAEYLRQLMASWQLVFARGAVRGAGDEGEPLWQWESEDGQLRARAMMEPNADLSIRFSASDLRFEGTRLRVHLGLLDAEITLQRVPESNAAEVTAKIAVPWQQRQGNMKVLSVEIL